MSPSPYFQPRTYPASRIDAALAEGAPLPVVVVGGGPVGMAVALGLSRRGIPVTVLEAADQVCFGSRAICISRHSLEVADRLGFGPDLEKIALPWVGGRSFYRDVEVLRFSMPYSEHDVRAPMVNVSQSHIEQVMVDHLQADPLVTYLWQVRVTDYTQDERSVTLHVDTAEGRRTLRADWVVAADGGRSRMRELTGASLQGTSYEGRYVIADIHWKSPLPVERRVWFDPPSNPGSTVIMHRQPNDIWRIDYQLDEGQDPAVETRRERIEERIAQHLDWLGNDLPWALEWHGLYTAHARALDDFVHGRVVFAGDSAHLVPIFGVRGLNSGMEDAETLSWMLAAVVHGTVDPALLRVYSLERHSAWEQNVQNAAKSTRIMTPGTQGYRATRAAILRLATIHPEFGSLVNPRQSSATHAHASPLTWHAEPGLAGTLPGDPVPDSAISTEAGEATSVHKLRGTGFSLLAFGDDTAWVAAVSQAATALTEALTPETCTAVFVNPVGEAPPSRTVRDERLQRDLGARDGEVFVVRPDGVLLARVTHLPDLARVPDSLRTGEAPEGGRKAPEWPDPTPPGDRRLEAVWLTLSEAFDRAEPEDREGFLLRLAFLLGSEVSPSRLSSSVGSALAEDPTRTT